MTRARGSSPASALIAAGLIAAGLATLAVQAPVALGQASPPWPAEPPDAERGLAVYAEHCAACHGSTGRGDGALVDQLPAPPLDLAAAGRRRSVAPADDFQTVTEGRLDRMMPPFAAALTDEQRWDVVVALRSFAETPHAIARGRAVWAIRCATCHGLPVGGEAGNLAVTGTARLGDFAALGAFADEALGARLVGTGPEDMAEPLASAEIAASATSGPAVPMAPAAALAHASAQDGLPPSGRADVLAYVRSLGFRALGAAGLAASARLRGAVVNATTGSAPVTEGLVILTARGGTVPEPAITSTVDAGGAFAFDDVVAGDDVVYEAVVVHDGARFAATSAISVPRAWAPGLGLSLPGASPAGAAAESHDVGTLKVWDVDRGLVVEAALLHTVVAPIAERGVLEIVERWVLVNGSDRAAADVRVSLPDGARSVRFADARLAEARVEPGAFVLPLALPPGEHEAVVVYDVPYAGRSAELARPLLQDVADASLTALGESVVVDATGIAASEAVTIGRAAGRRYRFDALEAGDRLVARLDGLPTSGAGTQDVVGARAPSPVAPEGLTWAALAATALGLGAIAAFARRGPGARAARRSRASAALRAKAAALERARAAGDLSPNDYAQNRARLLERTLRQMPGAARPPSEDARGSSATAPREPDDPLGQPPAAAAKEAHGGPP